MSSGPVSPDIRFHPEANDRTRVDVFAGGTSVSHCGIVQRTIGIGQSNVPLDGIDDVWTEPVHRGRGYARLLLEATVRRMRSDNAALAILYGISDFYPKFGFATVGYDFGIRLNELDRSYNIPDGWTIRAFSLGDTEAIRRIYERATADAVGPAVRPLVSAVWERLVACADPNRVVWEPYDGNTAAPARDECRVAVSPHGNVEAYFWRGKGTNYVNLDERYFPTSLCIGEVVATSPVAADAILAACRLFANEESARLTVDGYRPYQSIRLGVQPDSVVAAAAQYHTVWSVAYSWDCGGPMVRVLDLGRLFRALKPELELRWRTSRLAFRGTLQLRTDVGSIGLDLTDGDVAIGTSTASSVDKTRALQVDLPQTAVARLVLGGFPPQDLLARHGLSEDGPSTQVLAALFPQRHPYLFLADRP